MRELTINKNDANQRLDKFLSKAFPGMPSSLVYRSIRTNHIKVNGKKPKPEQKLNEGDKLNIYLNDDVLVKKDVQIYTSSEKVDVVYEDENIMLINKPVGLSVHDDETKDKDTLIARVISYLASTGKYNPGEEHSFTPALCNRLDRNTCGIVIVAKNAESLRIMNKMIAERKVKKHYLCLVHGVPEKKKATLKAYIRKDEEKKHSYVTDEPCKGALTMITKYELLKTDGNISLLSVDLMTGRTHQIRAHMAHIGHPLVGDGKYGNNAQYRKSGHKYQMLCANTVTFKFGDAGESLSYLNDKTFKISDPDFVNEIKQ